jgi:hypothetical protein
VCTRLCIEFFIFRSGFTILCFWILSIAMFYFLNTQGFGDWILFPQRGTSSLDWVQLSRFHLKTGQWIISRRTIIIGIVERLSFNDII